MAKLEKKKSQPVVCFPSELEREKCTGKLYGYFVESTNYYNVTSFIENDVNKEQSEIGEVFKEKPTQTFTKLTGYYENDVLQFVDVDDVVCKKEPYSLKLDIFSRNTGILESDIMLKTGAMFIGCGSVGSLFALELAKAGVGRFLLIDNDILGYHNICRHQCGIYDVGKYKTEAVKERILQINPTAKVVVQNTIVQDVSLSVFDEFCDKDTIVIGGADNREGDLYANQIAQEISMPLMSIGCWERAFAGEIFYCLPDGMPTYSDFMYAIGETSGRVSQNRKFYTNEEDLAKAAFEPGISADIDFVTIIAVKLALDILNRNNPNHTPRLLGHLSQYTLVCNTNNPKIGGDNAEIFSYPLQVTTSIEVHYAPKDEFKELNNNNKN
jgi:molybdopterin/thiamine biosynthesis adenylyltransferase